MSGTLAIKYRFITSSLHFQLCHSHLIFSKEKGKVTLVEEFVATLLQLSKPKDCTVNHT